MATGTLTIRVRPLRFAFLVDPADLAGLQSAIEVSTFLWGGPYNPIIPAFRQTPDDWELHRVRQPEPNEIVEGYLEGFDPDVVVPVGELGKGLDVGHRLSASILDVLGKFTETAAPRLGIGLVEVLWDLLESEFKYQRRDRLRLVFPRLPNSERTFLAAVFGALRPDVEAALKKHIPESVPAESPDVTLETYVTLLDSHLMFPRRLGYWSLQDRPRHAPTLFLCDATDGRDLIDFWNLRAAGHQVLPIAVQAAGTELVKSFARTFINDNFQPYRDNPQLFRHTTIQKSRGVTEEQAKSFCDSLQIDRPTEPHRFKFALRNWYPRIWDRWSRDQAQAGIRFPFSHVVEIPIAEGTKRLDLRSQDPHIALSRRSFSGLPKFANELEFALHGSNEPMAEVMPEGGREMASALGGFGYDDWRFSARGPVFLAKNERDLLFVDLPTAETVMTEWLRERGWSAALSAPGRMALQLYRQLGGAWGISWLAHRGVISLLAELEKEAGLSWAVVRGKLHHIIESEKLLFKEDRFLEGLIESNAIRLGASVQCPVCTRHNWYELDKLGYELQCKFCLSLFTPPLKSPKDMQWTYRAHGPFAGSTAQGGFSVLLTLKFLAGRSDHGRITPMFSYKARKDGVELESDLTCLYKGNRADSRIHVIHAECKSFGGFEPRDFERMDCLAREFPGATLIFSTLMDKLNTDNVVRLKALATENRERRLATQPYSPIIVLTGEELFSLHGAPECWKNAPFYEELSRTLYNEPVLDVLGDATQRLHLDMPGWHAWFEEQHRKKGGEV